MSSPELPNVEMIEPEAGWTTSLEAEEFGEFAAIQNAAFRVYNNGTQVSDCITQSGRYFDPIDGDWNEMGVEYVLGSKLYRKSSAELQRQMLASWGDSWRWMYGKTRSTDGLWDEEIAARTYSTDLISKFVLSGALGDSLFQESKALRKQSHELDMSPLDKAILVGGAALAASTKRYDNETGGATYVGASREQGLVQVVQTGGDIHGDFRTWSHLRPASSVGDTINMQRRHHFMPRIETRRALAYHGPESGIISGLLFHLVANGGRSRAELKAGLLARLAEERISVGGAFGDYGEKDGDFEASQLKQLIAADTPDRENREILFSYPVLPQSLHRFQLVAEDNSVAFQNTHEENITGGFSIANDDIEEYIVTLIRGGGGRTAPYAMLNVINALGDK